MMSNLSLTDRNNVDQWKTAWDDDEDDSDGETSPVLQQQQQQQQLLNGKPIKVPAHLSQPTFRPGLDVAHSAGVKQEGRARKGSSSSGVIQGTAVKPSKTLLKGNSHADDQDAKVLSQHVDKVTLQWDTTTNTSKNGEHNGHNRNGLEHEKPSVEMFFPVLRVLGKGSFGKVVLVRKRTGTESRGLFAMKILRKAHLVRRRQIERTKTERKVLSIANHPFIMKLHFAFQTEEKLYLVLDYCPGGELFFHLSRCRRFPERVARFYAAELLLAIGHLHRRGIIYRDLKPENVLLDADGHVKLGDFGLAKDEITEPCSGANSMCGTPEYMAPEVLSQQGHGKCVDFWALGMLVYEMMTGLPPWYTTEKALLFERIKSAPLVIHDYFSPSAASFISALLERNPRRRLGVDGIKTVMEHAFFKTIQWKKLLSKRVDAPIRPCDSWPNNDLQSYPSTVDNGTNNNHHANNPNSSNSAKNSNNNILQMDSITQDDIDIATSNFDPSFTRLPVETDFDIHAEQAYSGSEHGSEELNEQTFVGFTFDKIDNNNAVSSSSGRGSSSRQRVHHASSSQQQHSQRPQAGHNIYEKRRN